MTLQIDPYLARAASLMSDFPAPWVLCGGWAVDSWLGRKSRDHADVDFAIFHDDQLAVHRHFTTGWLLNGHDIHDDAGKDAWDGHHLQFPAHIHAFSQDGMELEFLTNRRSDEGWLLNEPAGVSLPASRAVTTSPSGLPTLAPEAVLFFKGAGDEIRPHDEADFHALAPNLNETQRAWLRDALAATQPDHPWLDTPALLTTREV